MRPALTILLLLLAAVPAWAETAAQRGRCLVEGLGACGNCRTPKGPAGDLPGKHLAGGFQIEEDFGVAVTLNITPDAETGIGRWPDRRIIASIYGARHDGQATLPPMPSQYYAAGIPESDTKAIIAYLRSLAPVPNRVPVPEPPQKR